MGSSGGVYVLVGGGGGRRGPRSRREEQTGEGSTLRGQALSWDGCKQPGGPEVCLESTRSTCCDTKQVFQGHLSLAVLVADLYPPPSIPKNPE